MCVYIALTKAVAIVHPPSLSCLSNGWHNVTPLLSCVSMEQLPWKPRVSIPRCLLPKGGPLGFTDGRDDLLVTYQSSESSAYLRGEKRSKTEVRRHGTNDRDMAKCRKEKHPTLSRLWKS